MTRRVVTPEEAADLAKAIASARIEALEKQVEVLEAKVASLTSLVNAQDRDYDRRIFQAMRLAERCKEKLELLFDHLELAIEEKPAETVVVKRPKYFRIFRG